MISRRNFLRTAAYTAAALNAILTDSEARSGAPNFEPPYRHSLQRHFGKYEHETPDWYRLRDGLDFARIRIYNDSVPVDSIAVVRADPERNRFRVFHDGRKLKTIEQWRDVTGADVMFNSSYYGYSMKSAYDIGSVDPVTRIIVNGEQKGNFVTGSPCGMLLSESTNSNVPYTRLVDLTSEPIAHHVKSVQKGKNIEKVIILDTPYQQGVQSWPMLLTADGNIPTYKLVRTKDGNIIKKPLPRTWYANRTAICDDKDGRILAVTTEGGFFSLYELGRFLHSSRLGIRNALNMDGGYEADMAIKMPNLHYVTYGQWETQGRRDISIPGSRIILPAVVGIFPR